MNKFIGATIVFFLLMASNSFSDEKEKSGAIEKLKNATCEGFFFGIKAGKNCEKKREAASKIKKESVQKQSKFKKRVCEGFFFGIKAGKDCEQYREDIIKSAKQDENKIKKKEYKKYSLNETSSNTDISLYTGTFDVIDKEGDDQTTLIGIEHRNTDLFRNTFLGKFAPVTGAFVTGKDSLYFYTGVEGQYDVGPIKISPSFTPGYYEKGSGKDLGSAFEFKSEIKVGFDILENSKLGYSYSHISNNDWGSTNPGTDNQQITFSTKF